MKVNEFRGQTRDRYNSWPSTRRVKKMNFTANVHIQKSQSHEDVFGRRTNTNTNHMKTSSAAVLTPTEKHTFI